MVFFIKNFGLIFRHSKNITALFYSAIATFTIFFTLEDIGIKDMWIKILIIILVPVIAFMITAFRTFITKKNIIYKNGNASISLMVSDLFKIALNKNKQIIVIPVNTEFDTVVDNIRISEKSIHGQFINKILKKHKKISFDKPQKSEIGEIVELTVENNIYYLVALSKLDENNNAYGSKDGFLLCLDEILNKYDREGQGFNLYIPLMGTGLSRLDYNDKLSLEIIKNFLLAKRHKIRGAITVVIYNKKRSISVLD